MTGIPYRPPSSRNPTEETQPATAAITRPGPKSGGSITLTVPGGRFRSRRERADRGQAAGGG